MAVSEQLEANATELALMNDQNDQRTRFEKHLIEADVALHFLYRALHESDAERAIRLSVHARLAILTSRKMCEHLGEPSCARSLLGGLRHNARDVLSKFLHEGMEAIGHTSYRNTDVVEQASRVAVLAMLWKVADALDHVEGQRPS